MTPNLSEPYVHSIARRFGQDFDLSTGILLNFGGKGVYEIQRKGRWREVNGDTIVGFVGIGGKYEQRDGSLTDCAQRECQEELQTGVDFKDASQTYLFTKSGIEQFPITPSQGLIRPRYIVINERSEEGRAPYTLVAVFEGQLQSRPKAGDVSGIAYITDSVLQQSFQSGEARLSELLGNGATIDEVFEIPRDIVLKPFGTVAAHLRYLADETKNS